MNKALTEGPQRVTRHGEPTVVVISAETYEQSFETEKPTQQSLVNLMKRCPAPEIFDYIEDDRNSPDYGREMNFDDSESE